MSRYIKGIMVGVTMLIALVLLPQTVEVVDSGEYAVIQSVSGNLDVFTTPGPKLQMFGKVTKYPIRSIYELEHEVRFNDGGHATMIGSIQFEMPVATDRLVELHTRYKSAEAIKSQLIEPVVKKAIYMTGPLMSSRESYAEKRNSLLHYVEDQIVNGVYQTRQRDERSKDPLTGADKTVTIVEIVSGKNGLPARQEDPVLTSYGVRTFGFSITKMPYDGSVEKQIQAQQQIIMDVQTAIADAKKAEQRALTVEQQGIAEAAKAKWDQEVIKAKFVTEAEQKLQIAQLDTKTADQQKQAMLLRAEGESQARAKLMAADGALEKKLETYIAVQKVWAEAASNYKGAWVPSVVMGNTGNSSSNGIDTMLQLIGAKAAKDLAVDLKIDQK